MPGPLAVLGALVGLYLFARSRDDEREAAPDETQFARHPPPPKAKPVSQPPPSAPKPPSPPLVAPVGTIDGLALAAQWPAFGYPGGTPVDQGTTPIAGGASLDRRALDALNRGECPIRWVPLRVTAPNERELTVIIADDDFCLGDKTRARLTVSRLGAKPILQAIESVLPTPLILDAMYGAAPMKFDARTWGGGYAANGPPGPPAWSKTSPPIPIPAKGSSLSNNPGFGRDIWLNRERWFESQRTIAGLTANTGKELCTSEQLARDDQGAHGPPIPRCGIYGWWMKTGGAYDVYSRRAAAPATRVWQYGSSVHPASFLDYSQMLRPVFRWASLDGFPVDLVKLYADPKLCKLVGSSIPLSPY